MSSPYLAAVVQMNSTEDKQRNVATAIRLIEEAADRGARLVALPELFNCLGDPTAIVEQAEAIPGPTSRRLAEVAAQRKVTLLAGSIAERDERTGQTFNTSLCFGPDGRELGRYRKIHLFDVDLPGRVTFRESDFLGRGEQVVATKTELGTLGQTTCYDLRFPELFRRLVDLQADVVAVPSAFTLPTGRDHWEVLLRARAIENQVYVIAPNQYGRHTESMQTYGRSMIVDPWGIVLATVVDGEGIALAEIDPRRQSEIRASLPALEHRRLRDGDQSSVIDHQ